MSNYTGSTCPVCHKKFTDQDDIVVCPDCGTPYHRACWPKAGCVNADKHGAYEWQPDNVPADADPACPNCGAHNPPGAHFCNHCGVPLPDHPENADRPPQPEPHRPVYDDPAYDPSAARRTGPAAGQAGPHIESYAAGPDGSVYRRELGPDDTIEGVKTRDWATFLGPAGMFYLMQFFRMEQTKHKIGFSLSAFVFGPAYLFYRKMWKEGAIFAALDLLCSLPTCLAMLVISDAPITAAMPTAWLEIGLNVAAVLNWGVMIARGFLAVYWYRNTCLRRIRAICAAQPEGQARQDQLALRGGTSVPAVLGYLVAYFSLSGVLLLLGLDPVAVSSLLMM